MSRKRTWTDEDFTKAASVSTSVRDLLKKIGLHPTGANYKTVWATVRRLGINTKHWVGSGHLKGKTHNWSKCLPFEEILIKDSHYRGSTSRLKSRLIKNGKLLNKCYECGQEPLWKGKILVHVLDHINGDNTDNRIENLRLLCPNCNSQTETFAGKNRKFVHC